MMRGAKILTICRWASAFINVTLHCCTPARAMDSVLPGLVMTVSGDNVKFGHAPDAATAPRFHVASGDTNLFTIVPGLRNAGPPPPERRHDAVLFEVVPLKHSWEAPPGRIPAR
jgi:hypothetical protein